MSKPLGFANQLELFMRSYRQTKQSNEIVMGLSFVIVAVAVLAALSVFAAQV